MEISPAVQPPKVGDPITAKWAADLAAAVNSAANPAEESGSVSSPFGKASPVAGVPMLGAWQKWMPFDCQLFQPSGGGDLALYCYLPAPGAFVFVDGLAVRYKSQVGTNTNPWVSIGTVARATTTRLGLAFRDDGANASGGRFKWELFLQTTSGALYPSGFTPAVAMPIVPIATMTIPADPAVGVTAQVDISGKTGLVQFQRGALNLSRQWVRFDTTYQESWRLKSFDGAADIAKSQEGVDPELLGTWGADTIDAQTLKAQTLTVGGTTYSQQTVNIGGTNYKLLVGT
jgi:hypothetical protein